jgi:ATP-binding cassette, subfamily B, bacterial PglK
MSFFNKFFLIISNFKLKTLNFIFLSLITILLEIFSVGMIFPAISILSGNEIIFFDFNLGIYLSEISSSYNTNVEFIILFVLLTFFFIKFSFMVFFIVYQARFTALMATSISQNLFTKYIYSDYSLYFKKTSSELIRNVLGEANNFIKKVFIPCLQISMDILILSGILLLIFLVDYKSSSILVLIYSSFGVIYFLLVKKKLYSIGKQQLQFDQIRIKNSQEAFLGIKTIKIFLKEKNFIDKYVYFYKKVANLSKSQSIIQQIPKHIIELLTIISFVTICILLMKNSINFNEIIPTLTLFVTAAFRIIPATNRLMNNNQIIRSGLSTLNNLAKEISDLKVNFNQNLNTKEIKNFNVIKIKNLSFGYNNKKNIFENINLKIKKGDRIGIIGKTGCGKTTFIDLLLGLIKPIEGLIILDDDNINEIDSSWKNILGYVPQEVFLLDDTIKNNIIFDDKVDVDEESLNYALQNSEINEFLENNNELNTKIGERGIALSGGQKQRIGIARALYKKPKIIIFDESTNSLDMETEKKIMDSIYSLDENITLIIISHRKSILSRCSKIFEIKDKKITLVEND